MQKACHTCGGRPTVCGHPQATTRAGGTPYYRKQRGAVLAGATVCWLCGEGPRPGDPLETHHLIPAILGGGDSADNLAPAHRSCNRSQGSE